MGHTCWSSRGIIISADQSRDTSTMANSARDGGQSARFRRAGALWNRGFGCLRLGERHAVSVGCSDRISQCHEIGSVSFAARSHSQLLQAEAFRKLDILHFLRGVLYQDFFRVRMLAGNCCRGSLGSSSDSRQTGDCRTLSLVGFAAWDGKCSGASVMSTRAVSSRGDVSPREPLDLVGGPAKTRTAASRLSTAADQEGEGSGGSTTMLRAKGFERQPLDAGSDKRDTRCCNERQSLGFDQGAGPNSDSPLPTPDQAAIRHASYRHQPTVGTTKPPRSKPQRVNS